MPCADEDEHGAACCGPSDSIRIYRVRMKLFPSIRRILVSGVWVEMKVQ